MFSVQHDPVKPEPSKPNEPAVSPRAVDPLTPYYFDAVKILGTGNSTGLFGALVGYYYFNLQGPIVLLWIKIAASFYLAGVCFFTLAFYSLFMFSVRQLEPTSKSFYPKGEAEVKTKVEWWRKAAITAGGASLIVWWVGTGVSVVVIYLISRTPVP
jgi:hypothetical protein